MSVVTNVSFLEIDVVLVFLLSIEDLELCYSMLGIIHVVRTQIVPIN